MIRFFAATMGVVGGAYTPPALTHISFLGDSITLATFPSTVTPRFSTAIASNLGLTEYNGGINSSTLTTQGANNPMVGRYSSLMQDSGLGWFVILGGVNDPASVAKATYKADLISIVNGLLAYGYPASRIVVCKPCWTGYESDAGFATAMSERRSAIDEVQTSHSIQVADFYTPTFQQVSLYQDEGAGNELHPNAAGHQIIFEAFLAAIP